jgi:hypothetical protein
METEKLGNFVDGVVEASYRAGCFAKEDVQKVLITADMVKQKLNEADKLANENLDLKVKIETLEAGLLRYEKLLGGTKDEDVINDINLADDSFEDISNHSSNGTVPNEVFTMPKVSKIKKAN